MSRSASRVQDSARNIPSFHRDTAATSASCAVRSQSFLDVRMKFTVKSLAKLGLLPLLAILSVGSSSAQTDLGKTILEKLTARVAKLESACADEIQK